MKSTVLLCALVAMSSQAFAQMVRVDTRDFQITTDERSAIIKGAVTALNENYVFPEVAKKMGVAVLARVAKQEYNSITKASELARKLTADFLEVSHDKHLRVNYFADGVPSPSKGEPSAEEIKMLHDELARINFSFQKVERLEGNIGYLELTAFPPPQAAAQTLAAAMTFVAHTDALIVDLRRNGGGSPEMVVDVLSYFFDMPTRTNDIYERADNSTRQFWTAPTVLGLRYGGKKPVYVLTSSRTFSGGEDFAYSIQSLKRATVVGEVTGGGAHPTRPVNISERFAISVPFARSISPVTGTNWEGVGVKPDISVAAADALETAIQLAKQKFSAATQAVPRVN